MDANLFPESPVDDAVPTRRPTFWRRVWAGLHTLKARLAAGALAAMFTGMATIAWYMGDVAESFLLNQAQAREQAAAEQLAAVMARGVTERRRVLELLADQLDAPTLADPAALLRVLRERPVLLQAFANVAVCGPDGQVRLLVDGAGARQPEVSIADRAYFREVMRQSAPHLSGPVPGRISDEPVLLLAQPLVEQGRVIGVLSGALRLASRSLVDQLAGQAVQEGAALVAVTDAQGVTLAHPQRAQMLQPLGADARLADVAALWRTAGRPATSPPGRWSTSDWVVAQAPVPGTDWLVWRTASRQAVLAPMKQARDRALKMAALIAVGMAAVLVVFLAWQLRPLGLLERRAAALLAGGDADNWPAFDGEIGRLSRTLRHVWVERAQVERFNAEVLQKLSSVMSASPVGLAFARHQRFELVSAECCRLLGRSEGELVGQLLQTIYASNEEYQAIEPRLAAALDGEGPYMGESQLLRADGTVFWARVHARPVAAGDASAGTIWSFYDISDQMDVRRQLEYAAAHDPLTGVFNRKGFEQVAGRLFAGQPGTRPAAIVMLDLDHFKPINDTAGHAAGDAMLQAVAQAITAHLRASDAVARIGGDEFAVLLPGCEEGRAMKIAEKVRQAILDLQLTWDGHSLRVGASLGVAELRADHASVANWLAEADAACYAVKHSGRGAIRAGARAAGLRLV